MVWAREYTRDQEKREKNTGRRVRPRLGNMQFVDIEDTPRGSAVTKLEVKVADGHSFEPAAINGSSAGNSASRADADGGTGLASGKRMLLDDLIGGCVFDAIAMDAASEFASIIWGEENVIPAVVLPEFDPNMPQAPILLSPLRSLKKCGRRSNDSGGLIACTTVLTFGAGSSPSATDPPRPTGVVVTTEAGCLGLRVESVESDSAGGLAGIAEDDLIMGINGATFDVPTGLVAQQYFDSLVHLSTMAAKKQNCQIHLLRPCSLVKCHIKRAAVNDGFAPLQLTMTTHDDRVVGRTHKCAKIKPGGPAAASGLQTNDVIMQIDGAYVAHLAHWQVLKQLGRAGSFWLVIGRAKLEGLRDENTRPPDIKAVEGFLCPVCQMNLGSAEALTAHFESAHPAPPPPPPEKAFAEPPRFCRFCGDRYDDMDAKEVEEHNRMHEHDIKGGASSAAPQGGTAGKTITDRDQKRAAAAAAAAVAAAAAAAGSPKTPRSKWNFSLFSRSPKAGRSNTKSSSASRAPSSLSQHQKIGSSTLANGLIKRGKAHGGDGLSLRSAQKLASLSNADASGSMTAAVFRHIGRDGKRNFYNDTDCKLIKIALEYGDAIVRINDVDVVGGERLRFEVRFGPAAKLRGSSGLSPTGMVQVNLDTGATRVVEQLLSGPVGGSSGAGGAHSSSKSELLQATGHQQPNVGPNDVGNKVRVVGYSSPGTLAFYGPHATHGRIRCGVILDNGTGLNNGTVQGHQYFSCLPKYGVLVVPQKVRLSY